ncbi:MAG TPA: type V CRISPR-associated protein Cas12b [Phycisphaerales bacterium]|nr:type V CRISPR-associated protein Cas12b [Phycisphaerales bacterium]
MAKKGAAGSRAARPTHPEGSRVSVRDIEPVTTQRAYTLRLRGPDPDDNSWREALWATHEAINAGAKVFGDWLLTLRGGLCHTLAEPPPPANDRSRSEQDTNALRRNRRVLLALSWLSVEDARGAPDGDRIRVATGAETKAKRDDKVLAALRTILAERGVSEPEIDSWDRDCAGSLAARIRDDAVWINRSACFDAAVRRIGPSLTREEVWDILEPFFASRESYLAPVTLADDEDDGGKEEKAKDLVQKAGQWLSSRFGTGRGADFATMAKMYKAMADWARSAPDFEDGQAALTHLADALTDFHPESRTADGLLGLISGPGYKSATRNIIKAWGDRVEAIGRTELDRFADVTSADHAGSLGKVGGKGRRPWSDHILQAVEQECGFTYLQNDGPAQHSEFAVMLDHAARRVSIGHSWIKRAEAQRLRFEQDAARLAGVPGDAAAWLDAFIVERCGTAGGDYRIRRRAIEGWDKVVERWSARGCDTADDRIKAARGLQDDPEIDKFGDIQLFEALAADDAEIVWQRGGKPDAAALKDYVLGHDARFRQQHYKVPAYRHPDPLRHPVFGDFGNSRWDIAYAAHEAAKAAGSKRAPDARNAAWLRDRHGLRLGLWDGSAVRQVPMRWSSKRLSNDLALGLDHAADTVRAVTRADRLGRAAAGLEAGEVPTAAGLFALDDWNGRLQAPRAELDAIAQRIDRFGWDAKAKAMRGRLSWLVSFSAKLECRGPFVEYGLRHQLIDPTREIGLKPRNKKDEWRGLSYPFWHPANDGHKGNAKHHLSRLPGLRVLSVDLGHRFAASCAVWEAISGEQFKRECAGRVIAAGSATGIFCHTLHNDERGKPRTTIYRRIGADTLADGTPHPAPWARLERQFLIKVQGEEQAPRRASPGERNAVREFESSIGRLRAADDLPWRVDELMAEAVRTARLGLYRHADAARIAYAFMPGGKRHTPGGGAEEHSPETRTAAMLDALVRWHGVCGDARSRRRDERAESAWDTHIAPRLAAALPELAEEATGPERKAHRKKIEEVLKPLATELAARGDAGVPELFELWRTRWEADHAQWPGHLKRLNRWLLPRSLHAAMNESTGQTQQRKARLGAARNVGGLSLTRIATIRELWQVQKAFHYGAQPCDLRAGVRTIEEDSAAGRKFGEKALRTMERMREQRVKQIASRIAASALGLGGHWKEVIRRDHAGRALLDADGKPRRKSVWVEEPSARYAPCHAIVIENLRNYKFADTQPRRENRGLMSWSAGKVRKYLEEACQLSGLHLRPVSPNYTSRQCSRTGLPGHRCQDISVSDFLDKAWCRKRVRQAKERKENSTKDRPFDAAARFFVALDELWPDRSSIPKARREEYAEKARNAKPIRILSKSGDLFVAAPPRSCREVGHQPCPMCDGKRVIQADLNAAANIGLRALLDPDFAGRWWYVTASIEDGWRVPMPKSCAGAACLDGWKVAPKQGKDFLCADGSPLSEAVKQATQQLEEAKRERDAAKSAAKKKGADQTLLAQTQARYEVAKKAHDDAKKAASQKEIVNLWKDPDARPGSLSEGAWWDPGAYWRMVERRVMARLSKANGLVDNPKPECDEDIETPF